MTLGTHLIVAGGVMLGLALHQLRPFEVPIHAQALRGGPAQADSHDGGYVGSEACERCHVGAYATWSRSLHVQMTRPVERGSVLGDFRRGTRLARYGRSYTMGRSGGRYIITVAHQQQPPESYDVHYTLGARRFQGYLSRLPDGRIYVLPVFWHVETAQWVDFKEITPLPDGDHDMRQIWNVNCVNCHATNLVTGFDPATKTYNTRWAEMGIGCEACHGPAAAHVELMRRWEADPASRPELGTRSSDQDRSAILRIFAASSATPRQVFDVCGYCHGNKVNFFAGFRPGDRYENYALPFLISEPMPPEDPQGDFWPDGRPNRFNRPQALMQSGCFAGQRITCTSCHRAHGSPNDPSLKVPITATGRDPVLTEPLPGSDQLCTQCHDTYPLPRHTHHPPESAGSRCISCHMSEVNWRMLNRRRDHTFAAPVPELRAGYGVPDACTTCHDDRTPEWAAGVMDRWYGDSARRRRALELADTLYAAGSGEISALPRLAALVVDRDAGPIVRASAAEFLGRLLSRLDVTPASRPDDRARTLPGVDTTLASRVRNALMGAASDSEPVVRATAVRALGIFGEVSGERQVIPPLVARLTDSGRVVRVRAAEALLHQGIVTLEGEAGAVLNRAQDEYATHLQAFPDNAADHAALGWLELARGRFDNAERALKTAIDLAPSTARPRVLLGVLFARGARYDEAMREWRAAQRLDPSYPQIDRLIEEARTRRATP